MFVDKTFNQSFCSPSRFAYAYIDQVKWFIFTGHEDIDSKNLPESSKNNYFNLESWLFLVLLATHSLRNIQKAVSVCLSVCVHVEVLRNYRVAFCLIYKLQVNVGTTARDLRFWWPWLYRLPSFFDRTPHSLENRWRFGKNWYFQQFNKCAGSGFFQNMINF